MSEELLKVIESEEWGDQYAGRAGDCFMYKHNESLERIAEAAKKPRVMKVWSEDCKPEKAGLYWIKELGCEKIFAKMLTVMEIQDGVAYCLPNKRIACWLEIEPTPILPENKE